MRYTQLESTAIIQTISNLRDRIAERFPDSGLSAVSAELLALARQTEGQMERIGRPIWPLRVAAVIAIILLLLVSVSLFRMAFDLEPLGNSLPEFIQGTDSALNLLVLLSIAIYFLFSLEERVKRRAALGTIHKLRSVVHIIDMHQLTKDPEFILTPGSATTTSPRRLLSRFELTRYLDYCSELLSLTSKVSALIVQEIRDPVVLEAVSDIESLAATLSNKIWQKIMILDMVAVEARPGGPMSRLVAGADPSP